MARIPVLSRMVREEEMDLLVTRGGTTHDEIIYAVTMARDEESAMRVEKFVSAFCFALVSRAHTAIRLDSGSFAIGR